MAGPRKPDVGADEFFALDLRAGRVLSVEDHLEAHRPAYKLEVDFGPHVGVLGTSAQITNYSRDELRDRLVAGVVNLGNKRIAGFDSEFLILGAIEGDGTVKLVALEDDVPPGSPIA
jgi:tRNA-binding protein